MAEAGPAARRVVPAFCVLVTLLALVTPVGRLLRRTELSYNEGWNVAAAMRLAPGAAANPQLPRNTGTAPLDGGCCQAELYPAAWGWTTVNYPVGSFALLAALHGVTGEYLVTGRVVSLASLLLCGVLLGAIAQALGATRRATLLGGLLGVAVLCVCAVEYAGVDDPQLLGDALFLLALWVYVRERRRLDWAVPSYAATAGAAVLCVVAGCVKQSPIDFPLAMLLDLLLLSRRRAAWFALWGAAAGAAAVWLNVRVGGPWFVRELLLGRLYSWTKAWGVAVSVLGPMLVPAVLAGWMAWRLRHDARRRIAALLLPVSVVVGGYFGGGSGVAGNALFTALLATVLLLALLWGDAECGGLAGWPRPGWRRGWPAALVLPVVCFGWLVTPALVQGVASPAANLRDAAAAEGRFGQARALVQGQSGPALCESMLLCLEAGKPYVFDPFNATRLMLQGRLSEAALVGEIDAHRYGAIQLHAAVPGGREPDDLMPERLTPVVLRAIDRSYTLRLQTADAAVYLPRDSRAGGASR